MTTPGSPLPPVYTTGIRNPWITKSRRVNPGMLRKYRELVGPGFYRWSAGASRKYPK